MNWEIPWVIGMAFCLLVVGFAIGNIYSLESIGEIVTPPLAEPNLLTNKLCENLSFKETVDCLTLELKEFYYYNISNVDLYWNGGFPKVTNWEKIKDEGGVCWHYAEWYVIRAKQLGLNGKRIRIDYDPYDHAISMLTNDKDEYCILDQTNLIGCGKIGSLGVDDDKIK